MANTIVFDTEILGGRFLFKGRVLENRNLITIWLHHPDAVQRLRNVMESGCLFVSFNGIRFDTPVISAALSGRSAKDIKIIADSIIAHDMQPWEVERRFGLPSLKFNHIDLIEVSPSFVSLKAYGARMHMPWLKDLPFPHNVESLTEEEYEQVDIYCENDLDTTEELYKRLHKEITLRISMGSEYGLDFRSKSDTQMAEAAFVKRLGLSRNKPRVPVSVSYKVPDFIEFESPHLAALAQRMEDTQYHVNQKSGHVELPAFLGKEIVKLNNGTYQMGVGGLHSTHDKKVCHVATDTYEIVDIDAASFYPMIAVNGGMIPQNTGAKFIDEYRAIIEKRLEAKRLWKLAEKAGDYKAVDGYKSTADSLRIAINGTFGKTASRWSPLYSPDLMIAITLTGQLTLLNLIERLEKVGAVALSANTDGIAMGYPKALKETVEGVVSAFSERSGFEFEYTPYRVIALKDVNNYVAVKLDRKVKAKGIYAPLDLKKNPTAPICAAAVCEWLARGTPFEDTIMKAPFTEFISARTVNGGGVQGEEYLGKVVRWYMSTETLPPLTYKTNGNKVPKTEGAKACMVIKDKVAHPRDLSYTWYLLEAIKIAVNLGCSEYLTAEQIAMVTPPPKVKKAKKVK